MILLEITAVTQHIIPDDEAEAADHLRMGKLDSGLFLHPALNLSKEIADEALAIIEKSLAEYAASL